METPESPIQSPQDGVSDSELPPSPEDEAGGVISDSEMLLEEENGGLTGEEEEEDDDEQGGRLDLEDEVVPDFVSDPEDEEPVEADRGQEDETIVLMEGDEDDPQGRRAAEEEDEVLDTPQSPDLEPEQDKENFESEEDGEGGDEGYGGYRKDTSVERDASEVEEDRNKEEEEEEDMRRALVREMKDDSASVSRELDEHELDYDEEVPEEPAHDEEEEEEDSKVEGGEEEEEENQEKKKKEKKPILPPSPGDDSKRLEGSKGSERLRERKKDEDDGEIDEGEIDVSLSVWLLGGTFILLLDRAEAHLKQGSATQTVQRAKKTNLPSAAKM